MLGEGGGSLDFLATFFENYFQLNLGTCQTETASQFRFFLGGAGETNRPNTLRRDKYLTGA